MSTILIARLIKRNHLTTQFISVEHDADFCRLIQAQLRAEEAPLRVQAIHAPLAPCDTSMDGLEWFNQGTLNHYLETFDNFDMTIVDGPPSYDRECQCGRYPALPFIWDKLKTDFVILLDDAHRRGLHRRSSGNIPPSGPRCRRSRPHPCGVCPSQFQIRQKA